MSIRSNFFYTRTVPCELWFFDRGKPKERCEQVLMIDARNVYRKINRTINDFSPEQMVNLSAIVWLYRGQNDRFLKLVADYLRSTCAEVKKVGTTLCSFESSFGNVDEVFANVRMEIEESENPVDDGEFLSAADEVSEIYQAYSTDRSELESGIVKFFRKYADAPLATVAEQGAARQAFDPIAERLRGMVKQIDLIYKLTACAADEARVFLKNLEDDNEGGNLPLRIRPAQAGPFAQGHG